MKPRVYSIDLLRGLVMIIMALDHTRDFLHFGAMSFQPEDLAHTTPLIFFTRWITHFCAPTFMFTAGLGAFLKFQRDGSRSSMARFLIARGLWLLVLEVTIVRFSFFLDWTFSPTLLLVFWALGMSMIALAGLIYLPVSVIGLIGTAMVTLHNLIPPYGPQQLASFGIFAKTIVVLHQPGLLWMTPPVILSYPLVPWIGVMALGFCAGRLYLLPVSQRRSILLSTGVALTTAFVALRVANVYGDPRVWAHQARPIFTAISFLNTTKYPPSLLFLLMTLGPALIFLGLFDRATATDWNPLLVFGRTPLAYFVVHLYLIHFLYIALAWMRYGAQRFIWIPPPTIGTPLEQFPAGFGWRMTTVYLAWIAVVALMYPLCLWLSRLKRDHRWWWLSYV